MANGVIAMDKDDREWIQGLFDKLPCAEHSVSITTLIAERDAAQKQVEAISIKKDWILKVCLAIITLLVFLQTFGVLKALINGVLKALVK